MFFSQGHPNSESPCPADNCNDSGAVLFGFLALGGVMDREQEVVSTESSDDVVVELSMELLDMVGGASSAVAF